MRNSASSENFFQPHQKGRKTAIYYWARERRTRGRALISVSAQEDSHYTRQKPLGKQLSLVLAFLNKYKCLDKWLQLQCTLLSSSCWLWWDWKSVKIIELGHMWHFGALNLLPLQMEVRIAAWTSQPPWRGLTVGRCLQVSCCPCNVALISQRSPAEVRLMAPAMHLPSCAIYGTWINCCQKQVKVVIATSVS